MADAQAEFDFFKHYNVDGDKSIFVKDMDSQDLLLARNRLQETLSKLGNMPQVQKYADKFLFDTEKYDIVEFYVRGMVFDLESVIAGKSVGGFCLKEMPANIGAMYTPSQDRMKIEKKLLEEGSENDRMHVIAHENAHRICYKEYGDGSHGENWRGIMRDLDIRPDNDYFLKMYQL